MKKYRVKVLREQCYAVVVEADSEAEAVGHVKGRLRDTGRPNVRGGGSAERVGEPVWVVDSIEADEFLEAHSGKEAGEDPGYEHPAFGQYGEF